ncbi:isochorismate synthase [Nocardia mangyaensis]|uniref:isochorismate synthase n=1 Tax=Nocardia mangyaensis TaxID=2213200 RepID=UPI00267744CD|nr:isochorismate synthase [Nocardia mangyaensis]MDO3649369.1 isochorismate synthase [Nocardia mangyaensis]
MDRFLLARPDAVLRTTGVRAGYADPRQAVEALRGWRDRDNSSPGAPGQDGIVADHQDRRSEPGAAPRLVVGALPFDPREPAALWRPEVALHTAGPWRPAALPTLPGVRVVDEIPGAAEHVARVAKLVEQLGDPANDLRKVVAARSMVLAADGPLDPEVVAGHLLTRHPNASVYAVDLSAAGRTGETLIGATPEVLVARHGTRVSLRPLAGTLPRLPDPDADVNQARELLSSTKNHDEHAFVIDWIRERLTPVCAELHIPDAPELLSTEQVWHLATPIHGVLRDPSTTALDLALLLHPTPAVNGTPFAAALDAITAAEPHRGFYGGAVGWCAADGDGEWVVAIRGAELAADRRTLRASAGGGIVAASDPRAELAETTAKFRTLLGALRCDVPND